MIRTWEYFDPINSRSHWIYSYKLTESNIGISPAICLKCGFAVRQRTQHLAREFQNHVDEKALRLSNHIVNERFSNHTTHKRISLHTEIYGKFMKAHFAENRGYLVEPLRNIF